MQNPDVYSYYLTVDGSREEQEQIFTLLAKDPDIVGPEGYIFPDDLKSDEPYRVYSTPPQFGAVYEWPEDRMEEFLHSVAVQVPNAEIILEAQNEDNKAVYFEKRFRGELYQERRAVSVIPPIRRDAYIPFDRRQEFEQEAAVRPVYVLCEEFEDDDGIRSFTVVAISEDKDSLRMLMESKIQLDEYGFIAQKGVDDHSADHFSTEFQNGFVEYYILEQPVLSREQIMNSLRSTEHQSETEKNKKSLDEILSGAEDRIKTPVSEEPESSKDLER